MPSVQNLHLLTKHVARFKTTRITDAKLVQDQKVSFCFHGIYEAEMAATAKENIQKLLQENFRQGNLL